tara:strand:- start:196 stop:483 length:288 start_codon:yes stop_codon:yes gene_type:complete
MKQERAAEIKALEILVDWLNRLQPWAGWGVDWRNGPAVYHTNRVKKGQEIELRKNWLYETLPSNDKPTNRAVINQLRAMITAIILEQKEQKNVQR